MAAGHTQLQGVGRRPVNERIMELIQGGGTRRGWGCNKGVLVVERWDIRVHQTQQMKGTEDAEDPEGPDSKSRRDSSRCCIGGTL